MLPKVIISVVLLGLGVFFAGSYIKNNLPVDQKYPPAGGQQGHEQQGNQKSSNLTPGVNEPFYSKDGLYLTHSWPGEGNFSNEETEILLFNESRSSVEVKSFDLAYSVDGKTYPHKSGTWEKFPSKTSWEKLEYLNISPQYYKGEPLILEPGQKGKLHWHIQFDTQPLDGKQTVRVKLTLFKENQTINIDEQFNRDSGAVFSKDGH